jgi:hypothetical protein
MNQSNNRRANQVDISEILLLDTFGAKVKRNSISTQTYRPKDSVVIDYSLTKDYNKIHKHDHSSKPHIHDSNDRRCSLNSSGFDLHRHARYYFTTERTPCRVYIVYGGNALALSSFVESEDCTGAKLDTSDIFKNEYQKLTKSNLKNINLSKKFQKDAMNMIYCRETKSIIPLPPLTPSLSQIKSKTPTNLF